MASFLQPALYAHLFCSQNQPRWGCSIMLDTWADAPSTETDPPHWPQPTTDTWENPTTNCLAEPPQNASRMDVSYILTHGCCPRPLWAWLLSCNREVLQRQVSCGPPLLCLHFSILGMGQLKLSSPGAAMRERTNCLACEVNRLLLL